MPFITKNLKAKIEPRDFLNACTMLELREVEILIQSKEYQAKMLVDVGELQTIPEIRKQFIANHMRS